MSLNDCSSASQLPKIKIQNNFHFATPSTKEINNKWEQSKLFTVFQYLQYLINKQIFHAFLLNIKNYSPEVNNIQWREVK